MTVTAPLPEFPPALSELPGVAEWQANTAVPWVSPLARVLSFFRPGREAVKPRSKDLRALDAALTIYEAIAQDYEAARRCYDGLRVEIDIHGADAARITELSQLVQIADSIAEDAGHAFEAVRERFDRWEDREEKSNARLAATSLWLDLHDDRLQT